MLPDLSVNLPGGQIKHAPPVAALENAPRLQLEQFMLLPAPGGQQIGQIIKEEEGGAPPPPIWLGVGEEVSEKSGCLDEEETEGVGVSEGVLEGEGVALGKACEALTSS